MFQINLTGKVKETRGGEAICFSIPMGPLRIVCIAHIPDEGENSSVVYVKFINTKKDAKS